MALRGPSADPSSHHPAAHVCLRSRTNYCTSILKKRPRVDPGIARKSTAIQQYSHRFLRPLRNMLLQRSEIRNARANWQFLGLVDLPLDASEIRNNKKNTDVPHQYPLQRCVIALLMGK